MVDYAPRVLIVDDEPQMCAVLAVMFQHWGFETAVAENGVHALSFVSANLFDIATTDQMMPGMHGLELARAIKQQKPHLPIIMISGSRRPKMDHLDFFLQKPCDPTALHSAVDQALSIGAEGR